MSSAPPSPSRPGSSTVTPAAAPAAGSPGPGDATTTSSEPVTRVQRLLSKLLLALFILYCIEAGIFLVWAPWTTFWERAFAAWSSPGLTLLMANPWMRGAVTGFGLIHLVWGLHDLYRWLGGSFRRESPPT